MKKGQMEISFGMIFTIFIIIVIVAVSVYVIVSFQCNSRAIGCASFYKGLQDKLTEAWNSNNEINLVFENAAPNKADYLCFGNLSRISPNADEKTKKINSELKKKIFNRMKNMFVYPQKSCCEEANGGATLKYVKDREFFCVPVIKDKVKVKISKGFSDGLVSLSE